MRPTRRHILAGAAAAGTMTVLPFASRAAAHMSDSFDTETGPITVHPVHHASVVLETPVGVIYVDPVGEAAEYDGFPAPDLILVTHEHGDHYNADVLSAIKGDDTLLLTNPAVFDMLPEGLTDNAQAIANGEETSVLGITIEAIPAYNITEGRENFHPKGRDNGYVLNLPGFRVYVSGDTEGTDEMRALQDIDLAFVSMNLPFTMAADQAADAVSAFAPTYVYPYHFRGRDGGTQDPEEFASLLTSETEVKMGDWYAPGELG